MSRANALRQLKIMNPDCHNVLSFPKDILFQAVGPETGLRTMALADNLLQSGKFRLPHSPVIFEYPFQLIGVDGTPGKGEVVDSPSYIVLSELSLPEGATGQDIQDRAIMFQVLIEHPVILPDGTEKMGLLRHGPTDPSVKDAGFYVGLLTENEGREVGYSTLKSGTNEVVQDLNMNNFWSFIVEMSLVMVNDQIVVDREGGTCVRRHPIQRVRGVRHSVVRIGQFVTRYLTEQTTDLPTTRKSAHNRRGHLVTRGDRTYWRHGSRIHGGTDNQQYAVE